MSVSRTTPARWLVLLVPLVLAALSGCQTVHNVKIDAINDPSKPMGLAYHLDVFDPAGGVDKELGQLAAARMRDALAARGLYPAPATVQPDMVITGEFGVGPGQMKIIYRSPAAVTMGGYGSGGPSAKPIMVFEKYIKLTAREPLPEDAPRNRGDRGDELWSVHVSIEDPKRELAPYLEILASVSVDYIGANTGAEKHIVVDAATAGDGLKRRPGTPTN